MDRLKQPAAEHATALADGNIERARATGRKLIAMLSAYAGW